MCIINKIEFWLPSLSLAIFQIICLLHLGVSVCPRLCMNMICIYNAVNVLHPHGGIYK